MKIYLRWIVSLYFFWMIFFFCLRAIFAIIQNFSGYKISLTDFTLSLMYGIYMDLSMSAYFILIPTLLFFLQKYLPFNKIISVYSYLLIAVVSILYAGDSVLYREWGFRLDRTAFTYMIELREAASFVSLGNTVFMIFLFVVFVCGGIFLFRKIYKPYSGKTFFLINLVFLAFLILPIRGGTDIIPMNPGKVYFSSLPFANHVALNVTWNIMYSVFQSGKPNLDFKFMNDQDVETVLDSLFSNENQLVDTILKMDTPKVLFILLESYTAKLVHKKHEGKEVTPRLNEWIEKGIYFDNAYASGDRTEIGMAAIFSGFPAQPRSAIVHYPRKTEHLPSLIEKMKDKGYYPSFYYGGDASFASMNTYLFNAGCDEIIDKRQFPASSHDAKWGVHDHLLFEKLFDDIKKDHSKFLKICLSLSSHPPYETPEPPAWNSADEEIMFLNTAHYTDKHLGILFDKLSALPLWNELLIVLVADHGARFPGNDPYHVPAKFKIPLWFGGGAIDSSFHVDKVVSQVDIAPTVLHQLDLPYDDFVFSRNALAKNSKPFACYVFNNGFGWIDAGGANVYSIDKKGIILKEGNPTFDLKFGKAYVQKVISEFERR